VTPQKTILVADDERRWREHATDLLADLYKVECVNDCESVLARMGRGGIDLVVLDHLMPGTEPLSTGIDVCLHLKERHPDLPIVLYTGAWEGVNYPVDRAQLQVKTKASVVFKDGTDQKLDDLRARVDELLR
jgi:CheY-like chemotaxis protein